MEILSYCLGRKHSPNPNQPAGGPIKAIHLYQIAVLAKWQLAAKIQLLSAVFARVHATAPLIIWAKGQTKLIQAWSFDGPDDLFRSNGSAIAFFPVCVTVTVAVAVAETVATVIAITHNKELVALSRSALTEQLQVTLIYAIVSIRSLRGRNSHCP
jgi:hypothetical protein